MRLRCVAHDAFHCAAHILHRRIGQMLCADEKGIDAFAEAVIRHLAFGIGQQERAFQIAQPLQRIGGQYEGNGQHPRRFVRSIPEHNPLISRALCVYAARDVRTLPGDVGRDPVGAAFLLAHQGKERATGKRIKIRHVRGGDFAADCHVVFLDHALDGHAAFPVMTEAVGDDGVSNLIADFIRVPGGYLLGCQQHSAILPIKKGEPDMSALRWFLTGYSVSWRMSQLQPDLVGSCGRRTSLSALPWISYTYFSL